MPSQLGLSFALTFFVMFRHGRSIGGLEADFNNKVIAASIAPTARSETPMADAGILAPYLDAGRS